MQKIKRYKIVVFVLLFVGGCMWQSAQTCAKINTITAPTEKIAIAFYKTGGVIPNFDRWIRENAPYNVTPWALREKIYDQEMQRLQMSYQVFNPKKDYLIITTASSFKLLETENIKGKKAYSIYSEFSEAPEAFYFPYDFLGERIILMPYSLQEMMQSDITKNKYDYIKKNIKPNAKLRTVIRMKPVEADFSQPYEIDGLEQWVFKTRIASIELWDNKDDLVWEYTAPWYTSPHILEIKNLYDMRPKGSSFKKGTIKPTYNKFKEFKK